MAILILNSARGSRVALFGGGGMSVYNQNKISIHCCAIIFEINNATHFLEQHVPPYSALIQGQHVILYYIWTLSAVWPVLYSGMLLHQKGEYVYRENIYPKKELCCYMFENRTTTMNYSVCGISTLVIFPTASTNVSIRVLAILNTHICPVNVLTARKKPPYFFLAVEKKPRSPCAKKGDLKLLGKALRQRLACVIAPEPGPKREMDFCQKERENNRSPPPPYPLLFLFKLTHGMSKWSTV